MSTDDTVPVANLEAAYKGSWYTISGCGGDLWEWVEMMNGLLKEAGIGTPVAWYQATGKQVNTFAGPNGDPFPDDLPLLLFPLDGLDMSKLAVFRIVGEDRWFDDIVDIMRRWLHR